MRVEGDGTSEAIFADADGTAKTVTASYVSSDPVPTIKVHEVDFMVQIDDDNGSGTGGLYTFRPRAYDATQQKWFTLPNVESPETGAWVEDTRTITPGADVNILIRVKARGHALELQVKAGNASKADMLITAIRRIVGS